MKHHHENHAIILAAVLIGFIIVCAFIVITAYFTAARDMSATIDAVELRCENRRLVIEGCDKHGNNCAPIYMCGGE